MKSNVRSAALIVLLGLSVACDTAPLGGPSLPPVAPGLTTPQPTSTPISGIVYEVDTNGRRPVLGAGVDVSPEFQSWDPHVFTDHDGRFVSRVSGLRGLKIIATKEGYSQPCRVAVGDTAADNEVYLVSNELLSSNGAPGSLPLTAPVMTGRVFERTPQGEHGVAGAAVVIDFTGGDGWAPSATTVTDADGRYLVCNIVNSSGLGLAAYVKKAGYVDAFVGIGQEARPTFDIELRRP